MIRSKKACLLLSSFILTLTTAHLPLAQAAKPTPKEIKALDSVEGVYNLEKKRGNCPDPLRINRATLESIVVYSSEELINQNGVSWGHPAPFYGYITVASVVTKNGNASADPMGVDTGEFLKQGFWKNLSFLGKDGYLYGISYLMESKTFLNIVHYTGTSNQITLKKLSNGKLHYYTVKKYSNGEEARASCIYSAR